MKISIVILSWNRKADLEITLEKLSKQTIDNFEIIVVDNCSNDGSPEMVEIKFPNIVLIKLPKNLGMGAWNIGAINAKGDYLVFLDDDSYPENNALENVIQKFDNDPNLGAIAGLVYNLNTGKFWDAFGWFDLDEKPKFKQVFSFIGCGVAFRKDLFLKIGGYDMDYFVYSIELPLSILIYHNGYHIHFFPEIVFYHRFSAANRTSSRSYYYTTRNSLWTVWQFYPIMSSIFKTLELIFVSFLRAILNIKNFNPILEFFKANFSAFTKFNFYFRKNRVKLKKNIFGIINQSSSFHPIAAYLREKKSKDINS